MAAPADGAPAAAEARGGQGDEATAASSPSPDSIADVAMGGGEVPPGGSRPPDAPPTSDTSTAGAPHGRGTIGPSPSDDGPSSGGPDGDSGGGAPRAAGPSAGPSPGGPPIGPRERPLLDRFGSAAASLSRIVASDPGGWAALAAATAVRSEARSMAAEVGAGLLARAGPSVALAARRAEERWATRTRGQ